MIASSLKCVSDFTADFFSSEKELFSWIFLLQKTSRRTKILISPVWNKILKNWDTLFEVVNIIGVQCIKNYIKFCFTTRSWSFWTEHRKGTAKVTSGIENFLYNIFTENICSARSRMQVVVFCKRCVDFVEQRLKFSHFKGSIIPKGILRRNIEHFLKKPI